jgi:hypothetical protein
MVTMTHSIPDNPDALLTRDRTAEALTEAGYPIKAKTLATKATRGGGPPFSKFGPRALYRWGLALAWAKARLTAARHSTSEHDAASVMTSPSALAVSDATEEQRVNPETPRPRCRIAGAVVNESQKAHRSTK